MSTPIGIFDSGIGGLTVMRELIGLLPAEDMIYVGDTARVPYGTRSTRVVARYALQIAEFLVTRGVKMLVVACNTSSAEALPEIKEAFEVPVIGVIEPGAAAGAKATRNRKVGVIGTEATIRSGAYVEAIHKLDPQVEIYLQACPLLVPLAEEGWVDNQVARLTIAEYLRTLKHEKVDTVILGCTHFPLFRKIIEEEMGDGVVLVDSAGETALKVRELLTGHEDTEPPCDGSRYQFYVTDNPEKFRRLSPSFLGKETERITLISLP